MRKTILLLILITIAFFWYRSYQETTAENLALEESSMLIQKQIANVSKLIVTEGHFAEVYNYRDSKELFGILLKVDKKALVVVNANVTVAYDLSKITFRTEAATKTLFIDYIPEPEIQLNPDFEYYDVTADYLNPFDDKDYNKIKHNVKASLMKKVMQASLISNAENRLLSELQKFYILTNSLGWKLVYNEVPVSNANSIRILNP